MAASSKPSTSATRASTPGDFEYVCKLDLDLVLPPGYFEGLMQRMEAEPRLGIDLGQALVRASAHRRPRAGSVRRRDVGGHDQVLPAVAASREIGGFVQQVMWDGIDCHRARMLGWMAESVNDESLRFVHLRPQGASHKGIWTGRVTGGLRPVLHGHGAAVLPRERRLSRLRAPRARRQRRDALGLRSERA